MADVPIMKQIYSIPEMMKATVEGVNETAARVVGGLPAGLRRVVLTGCGDSLAASYSAAAAFSQMTELEVQVCPAIDLARFTPAAGLKEDSTLFVIVSNTGRVSRIVEAAKRIHSLGGLCLALTSDPHSPLTAEAGLIFPLALPAFSPSGPGMRSYCACLLALYALACALGRAAGGQGLLGQNRAVYESSVTLLPKMLDTGLDGLNAAALQAAGVLEGCAAFEFVGAGPGYGTAMLGQAKLLECGGAVCVLQNTEDWLHMNYFARKIDEVVLVFFAQKDSPAATREKELLEIALQMGRPVVLVADSLTDGTQGQLKWLETPCVPWWLAPLVQYLPVSMLAAHLGLLWGEEDFRGASGRYTACQNFASVAASKQVLIH